MCQMCEGYDAELRRHGIAPEPSERANHHRDGGPSGAQEPDKQTPTPAVEPNTRPAADQR